MYTKPNIDISPAFIHLCSLDKATGAIPSLSINGLTSNGLVPKYNKRVFTSINDPAFIPTIAQIVNTAKGRLVKDLRYYDLLANYQYCNGIYFFCDGDGQNRKVVYVGKAASRAIIERVGGHFSLRHWDFMNCLIKAIGNQKYPPMLVDRSLDDNTLSEILKQIGDYTFVFIPVLNTIDNHPSDEYTNAIGRIESALIKYYKNIKDNPQATYNRLSRKKPVRLVSQNVAKNLQD